MSIAPAAAAELQVAHQVIQRLLASQVFTDDGRKYVRASRASKCNFAYLEHPEAGSDNGKLQIRAIFSGRSGVDLFGRCISLGDSFHVTIRGTPYYRNGAIWLKDVDVRSDDRNTFYSRRVCSALARSLSTEFHYGVMDDARRLLETPTDKSQWHQQLLAFNVTGIRVTNDAIIVNLDFTLAVK